LLADPRSELLQLLHIGKLLLHDVHPADPFILVGPGPQALVAVPKAANAALLAPEIELLRIFLLQLIRQTEIQGGAIALEQIAAAARDRAQKFVEGIGKLLDAIDDQIIRHALERNAVLF